MPSSTFAGLFKKKKNSSDRFSYNNPNPSNPKKRRLSQFGQFGKSVVGTTYSNPVVLGMHSDYASSQRQSNSMTAFLTTHTASRTTRPHTRPQAPLGLFANLPAPLSSAYNPSTYQSDPLPALPSSSLNPSTQPLPISGPVSDALHNLTLRAVAGQHDRSPGISQVQLLDSILQDNSVINAYAAHCVLQQRASSSTRAGATRAGVDNSFSMSILANLLPPTSTTSPGHHHAVVSLRAHLKTFRDQAHLHNSPLLKTADKIYYFLATVFELPVWDGSKIKRPDRSALVTVEEYRKMVMHLDAGDLSAVKIPNRREEMATKVSTHAMPSPPVLHNAAALSVAEEKVKKWRSPTDRKLDEIKAKREQEEADTAAAAEAASAAEASPDGFTPEALMRTLTQAERSDCQALLNSNNNMKWEIEMDSISTTNLQTLNHGCWLSDEVISFYFKLLAKRDAELTAENPGRKRSHFFNSFFFAKLIDDDNGYKYSNVKRWGKKAPGGNVLLLDKVIVPCNLGNSHWTCICAFLKEKKIQYYDSFAGQGNRYLNALLQYLEDEAKKHGTPFDRDEWELVPTDLHKTPQQQNGYDCGVFTCTCADFLSVGLAGLDFSQPDIREQRLRFVHKITMGSLTA